MSPHRSVYTRVFLPTSLLLLIAASRVLRLGSWELVDDEVWTVWQTFGSVREIIHWTPYDWPPLYYLFIGGWKELVGIHPIVVAYSSVLWFLLGAASMYRVGLKIFKTPLAASLTMLVYSAMMFSIIISIMLRGYVVILGILPFALWLSLTYFERPNWRQGLALGVIFGLLFYITLSSSMAILWIVLYVSLVYPRRVIRWWLPAFVAALIAIPEMIRKFYLISDRKDSAHSIKLAPLFERLEVIYRDYGGEYFTLWLVLFVVAGAMLIWEVRRSRRYERIAILLMMTLGYTILMYYTHPLTGLFHATRYTIWLLVAFGLWMGGGLSSSATLNRLARCPCSEFDVVCPDSCQRLCS